MKNRVVVKLVSSPPPLSLREYVETVYPIIKFNVQNQKVYPENGYKNNNLWYIYRQIFYGLSSCLNKEDRVFYSPDIEDFLKSGKSFNDLINVNWGNRKGILEDYTKVHLEHIYTGSMFRDAVFEIFDSPMKDDEEAIEKIIELVNKNFYSAWITKIQNSKLNKCDRGKSIQSALKHYKDKDKGITLFNSKGNEISELNFS
jgi:hypothetical protein